MLRQKRKYDWNTARCWWRGIVLVCVVLLAFGRLHAAGNELEPLREECQTATSGFEHEKALQKARILKKEAEKANDNFYKAYADYYIGVSQLLMGNVQEGMSFLKIAERYAEENKNERLNMLILNAYAIHEANQSNYALAQRYFYKSLDIATRLDDESFIVKLEANLATVAFSLSDTTGLKYAQSLYRWAQKNEDAQMEFVGAYQCALMYYIKGDLDAALNYLQRAEKLAPVNNRAEQCAIFSLYGEIYYEKENYVEAIRLLDKALAFRNDAQISTVSDVYLCYIRVLNRQGKYRESNRMIDEWFASVRDKDLNIDENKFVEMRVANYEALGNLQGTVAELKRLTELDRQEYERDKQHSINELKVIYDIERREREADYQKQKFEDERLKTTFLSISVLCLLVVVALLLYYYHKRKKYYEAIVLKSRENIQIGNENLELKKELSSVGEKVTKIKEDKTDELYQNLCGLMENEKLYKNENLTREYLSELLNTNRTYLSQLIRERTGNGYSAFVNGYRIREAVKILSDPAQIDYPLKALYRDLGFSSVSTFYKVFQESMGMTPSNYRKTMARIERKTVEN